MVHGNYQLTRLKIIWARRDILMNWLARVIWINKFYRTTFSNLKNIISPNICFIHLVTF